MIEEKGRPGGCGDRSEGRSEENAGAEDNCICTPRNHMEKAAAAGLESDLLSETLKWQGRAEDLFSRVSGEAEFLENISAYLRDSRYFLEKKDLIRAFEAVIWAWAWMEIGLLKGILQERQ